MKKTGAIITLALLTAGPAQAACWTPAEVAAAKVRDLDTMLMVSALRCRFEAPEIVTKYNAMVERHRASLDEMNNRLVAHFADGVSARVAAGAYDSYVTRVANRYGAGAGGLSCASLMSLADAATAEIADLEGLVAVADRAEVVPDLSEGQCAAPVVVAAVDHDVAPSNLGGRVASVNVVASAPAATVTLASLQK